MIQTTTGAMISVSDVGIIISNGKGAIINITGPGADALDRLPDVGVYTRRLVNDDEQVRRMETLKAHALVAFIGRETDRVIAQPEPQLRKIRRRVGKHAARQRLVHFTPQQLFDLTIGRRRANHDAVIEVSDPPKQNALKFLSAKRIF
jgi:hypothetical protein